MDFLVLLTYEEPVAFEVSPGILFGGNCPLGYISVAACCCHSRGWV